MNDFERDLRTALTTLAREAVADDRPEVTATIPADDDERPVHGVRRAIAVAAAVALVGTGVAFAVSRRDAHERPAPDMRATVTALPPSPLSPRAAQMAVFTGRQVIIWGGRYQRNSNPAIAAPAQPGTRTALNDGALFDVETRQWRMLPPAPISARWGATAGWTGREMLVVGGRSDADGAGISFPSDGAAFDPARNRWRRLPDAPICPSRPGMWTDARLVVAGACANSAQFRVAAFDPANNTWHDLPAPRDAFNFFAVNGALYVWNGRDRGERFDAPTRRWVSFTARPQHPTGQETVAGGFSHTGFAVIGPRSTDAGGVAVDVFDPDAGPSHYESRDVGPLLSVTVDVPVAVEPDLLVWNQGNGYGWFARAGGSLGSVTRAQVPLDRTEETLLAVGRRRVFAWGGEAVPDGGGVSEPTNDGAIIEIP